jgi:ribonuclease E
LWHKIFGSPTDQTAKLADEAAPRDASVAPADFRDEPRSAGSGFADAHADEPMPIQEELGDLGRDEEGSDTSDESSPRDLKRGRRRRRGGRGRGKRRDGARSDSERSEHGASRPATDAADEFDDEPLLDDDDDDTMSDGLSEDGDGDEVVSGASAARSGSALQRSIPSWDEAIGFIVDTNMQARAQRRPPSRAGGRDNSSRGRSRGRRKS